MKRTAPWILSLCAAACFLDVTESAAATFAPTKAEFAAAAARGFKSELDLTKLPRHTDKQGRTYLTVDDMRLVIGEDGFIESAFTGNRWTDGVVYYVFDSAVTSANRQNWRDAAAAWTATAALTFTESTGSGNYIYVQNGSGNNSYVGMIGGQQIMNIASWTFKYIIAHEIGHALGLIHEHQRSDRDSYVTINYTYVQSGYEGNFQIAASTNYATYDFDSVMHYDKCSFSTDCPPGFTCACTHYTIAVLPPNTTQWQDAIGQRSHLSQLDGTGMAQRYGGGGGSGPEIAVEQPAGTGLTDSLSTSDFGSVTVGHQSNLTFTVKNVGTANLTGLSVSKDGTNSGEFAVGSLGAVTLAPNTSTTVSVTFAPAASGSRIAAIHIASNDADENPFDIAISGTGTFDQTVTGTTSGKPIWNRPNENGSSPPVALSTNATAVPYDAIGFTVGATGTYTLTSTATSPANWDNYLFLYANAFNAAAPLSNIVIGNDDDPSVGVSGFSLVLQTGTVYYAVNTGYNNSSAGAYSLVISGPGSVSFTAKPEVSSVTYSKTNGFTIIWKATVGFTYQIQRCTDPNFSSYTVIASGISGVEPTTQYTDSSPEAKAATRMFYRVVLQ